MAEEVLGATQIDLRAPLRGGLPRTLRQVGHVETQSAGRWKYGTCGQRGSRDREASGPSVQHHNAAAILNAWNLMNRPVSKFFVNSLGHAWFEADGERRFFTNVSEGFDWPD